MSRMPTHVWPRLLPALVAALCTVCSGDGVSHVTNPPTPLTCNQNPSGLSCPTVGSIQVTVGNVPADIPPPQILLFTPDGDEIFHSGSGTFLNLPRGTYSLFAQPTSGDSPIVRYEASRYFIERFVTPGRTEQVTFTYEPRTYGAVQFTVRNLPSGVAATFLVQSSGVWTRQPLREGINTVQFLDAGPCLITLPHIGKAAPQAHSIWAEVTVGSVTRVPEVFTYAEK
jgi:hypothetical protein